MRSALFCPKYSGIAVLNTVFANTYVNTSFRNTLKNNLIGNCFIPDDKIDARRSVLFTTYLGAAPQNPPVLAISEPSAKTGGATYGFTLEVDRSKINNPETRLIATTAVIRLVKADPPIQVMSVILYHSMIL